MRRTRITIYCYKYILVVEKTHQLRQFQHAGHGFEILVIDLDPSEQVVGAVVFHAGLAGFGLGVLDGDHGLGHGSVGRVFRGILANVRRPPENYNEKKKENSENRSKIRVYEYQILITRFNGRVCCAVGGGRRLSRVGWN